MIGEAAAPDVSAAAARAFTETVTALVG